MERDMKIPTAAHPMRLDLAGGGAVFVRRMKSSVRDVIAKQVGLTEGDQGSQMEFGQMVVRWGIVRAEGVTDPAGEASTEQIERRATVRNLGSIGSSELYDAISYNMDDYQAILLAVMGDSAETLTEGQSGNSGGSPSGSIGGE